MFKALFTITLIFSHLVWAELPDLCEEVRKRPGACEDGTDLPKSSSVQASIHALSDSVAVKLRELEASEHRAGRELKAVLLGRQGTDMQRFPILKDAGANGKARSLEQLVQQATVNDAFRQGDGGMTPPLQLQLAAEQDHSKELKYSHLGIAVRAKSGEWTVVNLLRKCKENSSGIYDTSLVDFFSDDMKNYNAEILVPTQNVQDRLEKLLLDPKTKTAVTEKLHVPIYNAVSRPDDLKEENSNQWVLDVTAAALKPIGEVKSRADARQVLKEMDFRPSLLLGTGINIFATSRLYESQLPNFACFRNQRYPNLGVVEITSALSIEEFLQRNHQLIKTVEVSAAADTTVSSASHSQGGAR
jgi:hypothetical protein